MKTYTSNCPELKITLHREQVKKIKVQHSSDAVEFFKEIWEGIDIYESVFVMYLNRANNTIGWYKASQGGITGTVCDPRLIMKKALDCLATSIILCHNHPSENLNPSKADEELTQKIKEACNFFDIKLLDHLIIATNGYYSFTDEGIL